MENILVFAKFKLYGEHDSKDGEILGKKASTGCGCKTVGKASF